MTDIDEDLAKAIHQAMPDALHEEVAKFKDELSIMPPPDAAKIEELKARLESLREQAIEHYRFMIEGPAGMTH